MELKNRHYQKAHLRHTLNLHIKFQLPSPFRIWEEMGRYARNKHNNKKNRQKTTFLGLRGAAMKLISRNT